MRTKGLGKARKNGVRLRCHHLIRAIHDSIRSSIWIRTHGFSKSYNLELDPWENLHTDNPSRRLKDLRIYNSTAGHRYSWLPAVRPRISTYLIALHKCYIR